MNSIIHAPVFVKQLPHSTRLVWLKAMSDAGFPLIKIWGCSPREDRRLPFEKNGITQKRLRCFCFVGRKGITCGSEGKHPIEGKDKNRSFKINFSYEVAKRTPKLNWGTPTGERSGFVVLDIDADKGGYESLNTLLADPANGAIPPTFSVLTGGGVHLPGKHLFFKHPGPDWHIKSLADHPELGVGIDVKGEGGYVVVAGSLHHSGNYYRPENNLSSSNDIALAELPAWLLEKIATRKSELPAQAAPLTPELIKAMADRFKQIKASESGQSLEKWAFAALEGECQTILTAPHHGNETQNKSAFRIGGIVGAGLLSYQDALAALLDAANTRGGKSQGTVARKSIESGLNSGMLHPRFPKPKTQENDDALGAWIASGGKASAIEEVITPESFSTVFDDNWDEFDSIFGPTLDRELELSQADPEAYAQYEAEEAERQAQGIGEASRNLSAVEQINLEERRLKRAEDSHSNRWHIQCSIPNESHLYPSHEEETCSNPPPHLWHRCSKCIALNRPCEACAREKIGVTRTSPGTVLCTRGKKLLLQSTAKGKEHELKKFHPKCGWAGCQICGFDYECDHLVHFITFGEWFIDSLDKPCLQVPSYNIEELTTTPVDIQSGVWKVLVPDKYSRKFANKLSKRKGQVYYLADYLGGDMYAYYCILTPGVDPACLCYTPRRGGGSVEITPVHITFDEFSTEHRKNLSNHGRYIKLTKSAWELCDLPAGARKRHNGVSYCRPLAMPKRFISSGKNKLLGCIILDQEQEEQACAEFGTEFKERDTHRIDKSYRRGLTQYLMKYGVYEFHEETPQRKLNKFIARLLGKDRIIEPDVAMPAYEEKGSTCYSYPLVT